ncbi:alpha/beta hydrolase [Agreia pratensis]|uniref:alpha/beta fold hydrolase n=1 Tax=Agreia pratensis TaxID=150121 RepID=UPI00188C2E4B|nr:alpha/beta hydrolase [Agreia pratensis]MBF4635068.1 alpha/beta hydrolase [Agreia pratensis]
MTEFVKSADGTRIAYDRLGSGALAIILVGSAMNYRAFDPTTVQIATLLADQGFSVVNYDRRGRGESGDAADYAVEREVDDIAALLDVLGGSAALYGNSSGGALALWAAATPGVGERITKLALFEVPLSLEGEGDGGADLRAMNELVAAGDQAAVVEYFMKDMPPQWLEGAKSSPAWPDMLAISHTLAYDEALLERAQHAPWAEQWASVTQPVIAMVGEPTVPIFPPAASALETALPNARALVIDAAHHSVRPEVMAALLGGFLTGHDELATFAEYPDEPRQQV